MCGMKTGAGENPFEDDDGGGDEEADAGGAPGTASGRGETAGTARRGGGEPADRPPGSRQRAPSDDRTARSSEPGAGGDGRLAPSDLPYIARRNARGDNVKAGRETRRLFELRPTVAGKEAAFIDALEDRLATDVSKTDAREAALDVVYERPDLVASRLEAWGINYFADED